MPVIGEPRRYHAKFKFVVQIDGVAFAGFQSCSELSAEIAKIEQWEGGAITPEKDPGRITFADITLTRGATKDKDLFLWFKQVADAAKNGGLITPQFKRNLDIVQQDRDGSTLLRWRLSEAWTNKFVAGDWDNTADENVLTSVTLTFKLFDLIQ